MPGMFYSLQEVAEKLGKSEDEVRELVRQGKLREFRDGPNLLFKVDEVEGLLGETGVTRSPQPGEQTEPQPQEEEISLAPEQEEEPAESGDLSSADTVISKDEDISVLGETDSDYNIADDTMAETRIGSDEASLEEIEEDVNLDSFGSGSGLLDLSLQADDTSLGGILDEIYTPEGEEEHPSAEQAEEGVASEAEQMMPGAEPSVPQAAPAALAALQGYIEPEPDMVSNALGIMLILPLLLMIYTAIVAIAGFRGLVPGIVRQTQGGTWYIMFGVAVVAGLIIGVAALKSRKVAGPGKKAAPPAAEENKAR